MRFVHSSCQVQQLFLQDRMRGFSPRTLDSFVFMQCSGSLSSVGVPGCLRS